MPGIRPGRVRRLGPLIPANFEGHHMTTQGYGVVAAVVALAAIFYFGSKKPEAVVTPPPVEVVKPPVVKPPVKPPVVKPPVKPPAKPDPNVIYHRVEQDGAQGPEVACTSVTRFAEGKSPAELAAIAKQYGVSVAEVQRWFVCVK